MTCPPEFHCPDGGAEVGAFLVIGMFVVIVGVALSLFAIRRLLEVLRDRRR